ncbi:hypothetical protein [Halalkalibacter krulwichiae]|uniref:Uncharacterized protein n=1 Tax=Halalkalibacter krulwichiae TaxID=199441 RepID=A0A1X9M7P4_9BACI|nr:hypothetical protein [Halalkalibacter krulwichiae]ARK29437.1 hypothetical protein BkAM31D_05980 [Halalkalibacter krulwichiae]
MIRIQFSLFTVIACMLLTGCNILTYEHEETYMVDATDISGFSINHDEGM